MKSKLLILLFAVVCVFIIFNENKEYRNQFQSDRCGYYIYLPAIFIYHDLAHLSFYHPVDSTYHHTLDLQYSLYPVNGKTLNKYPLGVAAFEAPFFFIANAYCKITRQYPDDGFSMPYQVAALFSTIFWVVSGLFILRRFLKRYFNESTAFITILCISFGTNLYAYTAFEGEMSHAYSFFLFSCLIALTDSWYTKPPYKRISILTGLTIGFIFIVRPINIIACIIPLLWRINNFASYKERMRYWAEYFGHVVIIVGVALLVSLIQFSYWKYITGHWLYYSYQGETFDFLHPNIIKGLFGYRKGWFIYTPIALIGMSGFYFLWKKQQKMVPALLLFFVFMIYGVFSWREWWYGCGFSCRPLIESLAFLSLPLAAVTEHYLNTNNFKKIAYMVTLLVFVALNILQTYQYSMGLLNCSRMTKAYYWYIFGQTDAKRDDCEKYLIRQSEEYDDEN